MVDALVPIYISTYVTIQELQNRLTKLESGVPATNSYSSYSSQIRGVDMNSIEAAVMKGEREKKLEQMVRATITSTLHDHIYFIHPVVTTSFKRRKKKRTRLFGSLSGWLGKSKSLISFIKMLVLRIFSIA